MTRRRALRLAPAVILITAGILSIVAQIFFLPGDVEPDDWQRAAEFVVDKVGPNDIINVQPHWSEAPYPYLTSVGDQINRQSRPLLGDIFTHERLWVLVETDRVDATLADMPFPAASVETFNTISVARIDIPSPGTVKYDLLGNLEHAQVSQVTPNGAVQQDCTVWDARERAWHCTRHNKWLYVGESFLTLGADPHRCIWANPPEAPRRWRISFPQVLMGQQFRFRAGLDFTGARSRRGKEIHYSVQVDDRWTETRVIPPRESTWEAIDFDTTELQGKTARVTLEVWSEAVLDRFFCFNGWSLEQPTP